MSKKITLCSGFALCMILLSGCSAFGFFGSSTINFKDISLNKPVTLNFGDSEVKLIKWNKNYIKVVTNEFTKNEVIITHVDNVITFDNEKYSNENPKSTMTGFHIWVPKNLPLEVNARKIRARSVTLLSVNTENGEIRECVLVENFIAAGEYINLRECTIGNYSLIRCTNLFMRDNTIETLVISTNNDQFVLNGEIRSTKGKTIQVQATQFNSLYLTLHHVTLETLIVESDRLEDGGEIVLEGSKVSDIQNNSKIKITEKAAI